MSMDLYLWKAPVIDDPREARALIDRHYDEDAAVFEPSEDVTQALDEIRRDFPDDAASDDCPWASWPLDDSDRLIAMNIRWSVDNAVLERIVAIAAAHDLVIYDPQGPDVYRARETPEPAPPIGATGYVKAFGFIVMFAGLTYAAWLIPYGWLRWPLVLIGLFFTAAALMAGWACVAASLEPEEAPR